jgi:HD-like signal output (HDOD) protein
VNAVAEPIIPNHIPIPAQPEVLRTIARERNKDDPDLTLITRAIASDARCSATVLKTVNSPFFGLRTKVSSVQHGVAILGTKMIFNIMSSVGLRMALEAQGNVIMPRFWDSCTDVSRLCAFLAKQLDGISADEAYTLGLFRDCGIPVLALRFPDYKKILKEANASTTETFAAVEDRSLRTNHIVVGHRMAKSWNLSEAICEGVRLHHDVEALFAQREQIDPGLAGLLAVLKVAEYVNDFSHNRTSHEWARTKLLVLAVLGLDETAFNELVDDSVEMLSKTI